MTSKTTNESSEFEKETTTKRRRQHVKNLFILDEAEADVGDETEEEVEEDLPEDDEEFQQELSRFRQHQTTLEPRDSPTIFSDLIQRLESNVPRSQRSQDTAGSSLYPLHDSGDLGQTFYNALEANLLRHPEASSLSSRYLIYHVRCLRGSEKGIIRRIQSEIMEYDQQHTNERIGRVIQDVLPSKAPGYLYLITLNDPNTIPLCQYLHSFSGFVYDKSIINRKSDFMPIHHVVTDFSPPPQTTDPKFSVGDWVTIRGAGLYTGCLGLIVPRDLRLSNSRQSHTVLTIPRIPKSIEDEKAAFTSDFKPPLFPFYYVDTLRISELYRLEKNDSWGDAGIPEWGEDVQSQCLPDISCTKDHSTEFFFRGHIFQCGLTLLSFRATQLQAAPSSFDPSIENTFINSHHIEVYRFHRSMPIPTSWSFAANELVLVQTSCPEKHLHGAEGVIFQVLDRECEVDFQGALHSISKRDLIKSFSPGDLVYCQEGSGSLVLVTGHSALVMIDERTRSILENKKRERAKDLLLRGDYSSLTDDLETPEYMEGGDFTVEPVAVYPVNSLSGSSTFQSSSSFANSSRIAPQPENTSSAVETRRRRSIWIGTRVIVKKHATRRGYKGVVVDVQRDDSTLSGLAVQVNYDVINVERGVEWLDYVEVRNEQSLQFLHEARYTGLDNYYHFKNKFTPSYSNLEKQAILRFKTLARARELDARVREADILEQQEEVRQLYELPIPSSDRWVLDPRWQLSLGKLEFFIQVHEGKWKSSDDRKVHLVVKDGRIEVRIRLGATNTRDKAETVPYTDICDIPAGGLRTKKVSARASNARCLYLVAFPHENSIQHIGKLVRRISQGQGAGVYFVQRVAVNSIPARSGFIEKLMDKEPFEIPHTSLLQVHMSQELTKQGNILMYNIRLKYGGQTIPADKTSGDSAIICETSTALASNSMGGMTPPASPHPEIKDWDAVDFV